MHRTFRVGLGLLTLVLFVVLAAAAWQFPPSLPLLVVAAVTLATVVTGLYLPWIEEQLSRWFLAGCVLGAGAFAVHQQEGIALLGGCSLVAALVLTVRRFEVVETDSDGGNEASVLAPERVVIPRGWSICILLVNAAVLPMIKVYLGIGLFH